MKLANEKQAAVLAVTDGLGFNRDRSREIVNDAWERLSTNERELIESASERIGHDISWAKNLLYPVHVESLEPNTPTREAITKINDLQTCRTFLSEQLIERIESLIEAVADEKRYVPWAAGSRELSNLRNTNLSIPTSASGIWVGFENLNPPVQGNSETGHQQIGNLEMAPQLPLRISNAIKSGDFFNNTALNSSIKGAKDRSATVNFCFLLSGISGADGRVHSSWNHLEAFLELVFDHHKLSTDHVQMQAILDGRDSAINSSILEENGSGNFLGHLEKLLGKYKAKSSLAWVVGRSTAMDRDYREIAAKADFDLLTGSPAYAVYGFNQLRSKISDVHSEGKVDQDVPPIAITRSDGSIPMISRGDVFINLNFRSDRQRSKIAVLASAIDFLKSEGEHRGKYWDTDWLNHGLNLDICTIAEYHPIFEDKYGISVAFPTAPHKQNFFAQWPELVGDDEYTLVAESVKASHMGYFLRGRRENPAERAQEIRLITPSHSENDGVESDTDFYIHPEMRTREITNDVIQAIKTNTSRLICCNIAAPDMVGHLLPDRYEQAKSAYRAAGNALVQIANASHASGRALVITSDHGNIEDDTSSHSTNDVLTTIVRPNNAISAVGIPMFQARLFDVAPTVLELLGESPNNSIDQSKEFVGRSIVARG